MAQNSYHYIPILILIATQGEPTDKNGKNQTFEFIKLINERNYDKIHISFQVTGPYGVSYLNNITAPNTNVINNYYTELLKMQLRYKQVNYSLGDHIVRWLLNTNDPNPFNLTKK